MPNFSLQTTVDNKNLIDYGLFTVIDSNPIDFVLIDAPIAHGHITCWKGLQQKHFDQFKKAGFEQIDRQPGAPSTKNPDRPAKTGDTQ